MNSIIEKFILKSIKSGIKNSQKEKRRAQREQISLETYFDKIEKLEQASLEVRRYDSFIESIISFHKHCGKYDWNTIKNAKPPNIPVKSNEFEQKARVDLLSYKPGIIDSIFKKNINKKRNELEEKIKIAIVADDDAYKKSKEKYQIDIKEYEELRELADKVLNGNIEAYENAIAKMLPLSLKTILDIDSGANIDFNIQSKDRINIVLHIQGVNIIPKQTKSLHKSGKLNVKDMPIGKYNELYQDYVCSSALRVAREVFALLPSINEILLNVKSDLLNSSNGCMEAQTILSVCFMRAILDSINFESIDPSDSIKCFKNNMEFKKTRGMSPVQNIE